MFLKTGKFFARGIGRGFSDRHLLDLAGALPLSTEVIAPRLPHASPERSQLARLYACQVGTDDIHVRACDAQCMSACRLNGQTFLAGDLSDQFAVFGGGSHGVDLQM
ncbi:MAG TPA: hypothetical protein PLN31_19830 [Azoarcus taiwanensis]|nr:hypothetical protein [Rhodocyclaceae bacterium]HRQ59674.1 hypothetical protein [Azoarcus taiwanensis]